MISLFISAFGLGFIFNASPGAIFTESLRRGVLGGYQAALSVQFGSLVGDAIWAILGLSGAGILFQIPEIRIPLATVGGLYLAYLGIQSIVTKPPTEQEQSAVTAPKSNNSALMSGVSISLTNPSNIFFWAALGSVLGGFGISNPEFAHYLIFFLGFMASSFIWCFACAGIIHVLHKAMSLTLVIGLNILCGVALLYLAYLICVDTYQVISKV